MGRPMIGDPARVPSDVLATALQGCVDRIILVDGDRDHMNHSDLTVEQSLAMSDLIRVAVAKLQNT